MLKLQLLSVVCGALLVSYLPQARSDEAPAGGAIADFDASFAEWKSLLTKLAEIQQQHRSAPPDTKNRLEKEFANTVLEGRRLEVKLTDLAEKAFKERSDPNSPAAEFLFTVAADNRIDGQRQLCLTGGTTKRAIG